jgi:hypothetical protein
MGGKKNVARKLFSKMNLVEKLTKQKYSAVITRVQIDKPII